MKSCIALDTNAVVAMFDGVSYIANIAQQSNKIIVPPTVCGEIYAGSLGESARETKTRVNFHRLLQTTGVVVPAISQNTALFYARIFNQLKAKGSLIPANDIWIAATALEHECPLLTNDKHFNRVTGLDVLSF